MKIELNQSPPTHFDFRIFWNNLPFFFKSLLTFTYIIAILGMFSQFLVEYFSNETIKSLRGFQIWRIFTSPYISLGMLHYTIAMINLYYIMPTIEKTYSTAFVFIDFIVQNFIVQLLFTLIVNVVYDFTTAVEHVYSCSLWNILIVYLIKICSIEDSQIQVCCMPFKISTKYYPLVMVLFYNLFTLPLLQFDIYLACFVGWIQVKCFNGNIIKYSVGCLSRVQKILIKLFGERADMQLIKKTEIQQYCAQLRKDYDNSYLQRLRQINLHNQQQHDKSMNTMTTEHIKISV